MSLSISEKQELLKELEKNYYLGVKEVEYDNRKMNFRTLPEMSSLIVTLRGELGMSKKVKRVQASFSGEGK